MPSFYKYSFSQSLRNRSFGQSNNKKLVRWIKCLGTKNGSGANTEERCKEVKSSLVESSLK
ncbi:hypothetical protein bcgnr5371_57940 [Bacillus cereus]